MPKLANLRTNATGFQTFVIRMIPLARLNAMMAIIISAAIVTTMLIAFAFPELARRRSVKLWRDATYPTELLICYQEMNAKHLANAANLATTPSVARAMYNMTTYVLPPVFSPIPTAMVNGSVTPDSVHIPILANLSANLADINFM